MNFCKKDTSVICSVEPLWRNGRRSRLKICHLLMWEFKSPWGYKTMLVMLYKFLDYVRSVVHIMLLILLVDMTFLYGANRVYHIRMRKQMKRYILPKNKVKKVLVIYHGNLEHIDGISNKHKQFQKVLKKKYDIQLDFMDTIDADFKLQSEIVIQGLPQHIVAFYTPKAYIKKFLDGNYDAVHIVEVLSPQAFAASRTFLHYGIPFTMSSHINYEEYIKDYRVSVPTYLLHLYFFLTARHAQRISVSSESMKHIAKKWIGYKPLSVVSNGIDSSIFNTKPLSDTDIRELEEELSRYKSDRPRPYLLCFSRIAPEKNLEAFFKMDYKGTKIMIGKGPALDKYKNLYKDVIFLGVKDQHTIAKYCKHADVFVFPSESETFGAVMIEASGCGLPVAALSRPGCVNAVKQGVNGYLVNNESELQKAVDMCLKLSREKAASYAAQHNWDNISELFLNNLYPINENLRKLTHDKLYRGSKSRVHLVW